MTHSEVIQSVSNWFKLKPDVEIVTRFSYSFPVPDIQIQYTDGTILQIECKPSNATRREYLTGLGQTIAFYRHSDKAYLALPSKEFSSMEDFLWPNFVGIILVDGSNVAVFRDPVKPKGIKPKIEKIKRGYAYYRDLKINEIYSVLLELKDSSYTVQNDPKKVDDVIWNGLQKIRNWKSSPKSNVLNTKLLLRDLKLFDFSMFQVTEIGKELLAMDVGDSEKLKAFFRKQFLIDGNYIDIIGIIQELNDEYDSFESTNFFVDLLSKKILQEKLATRRTNVKRDLRDIIRIFKELEIISSWKRFNNKKGKYFILWKNILNLIKFR